MLKKIVICFYVAVVLLSAISAKSKSIIAAEKISELAGKKIAVQVGTTHDELAKEVIKDANINYFPTTPDCFVALETGKVDAMITDYVIFDIYEAKYPGKVTLIQDGLPFVGFGFFTRKDNPVFQEFNEALKKLIESGERDAITRKWCGSDEESKVMPQKDWNGSRGTLRIAGSADYEPVYYIKDNQICGFDAEIISRIAKELDYDVVFENVDFSAITNMIASNKADIGCSGVGATAERAKEFNFTVEYYNGSACIGVKNDDPIAAGQANNFFGKIKESFIKNFIKESRWKLIVSGLKVTVIISVFSLIFGLLLGFAICMLRRMDKLPVNVISISFVRIIQGMPAVVLLMILYYIIFGSVDISGIIVAIIGFSINFGAYASEIFRAGMNSVEKGQIEAACALGYSKLQIFTKIIMPQAAVNFIPVLKGEFISMVKLTSIVGYIAVSDLTKASDIIRSRTMEAFFPLIMTAIIYFVIAVILTQTLVYVEKCVNPKQRKNILKGIKTKDSE